jgi:hypothetical protein
MKTKIALISLVFTLFTAAHFFATETHDTHMLDKGWISEAIEKINLSWKCEISDCQTDEDVYAQLAGDN